MKRYHRERYAEAKKRIDTETKNIEEILDIKEELTTRRIMGFKYNYSLQEVVQNFASFHMYIELNKEADYLYIYNRKPVERTKQVLESDPEVIAKMRAEEFKKMAQLEKEKKYYTNE